MKKIVSFLIDIQEQNIDDKLIKTILIDSITIGIGTVMFLCSVFNNYVNEEGVLVGSSLCILGILIRIWKKEIK